MPKQLRAEQYLYNRPTVARALPARAGTPAREARPRQDSQRRDGRVKGDGMKINLTLAALVGAACFIATDALLHIRRVTLQFQECPHCDGTFYTARYR